MRPRPRSLVLAVASLVVAACASAPPAPSETVAVIAPAASPSAPPAAHASASAQAAAEPPADEEPGPDCSDQAFEARLAEVQAAVSSGKRDRLKEALSKALELRARDVRLNGQLATLLREDGDLEGAGALGRVMVEQQGGESLGWLLVGLAAEAKGQPEEARAAFARSALADPQGEGARKLGTGSRCTAAAHAPDARSPLTIVTGWKGLFTEINPSRMVQEDKPDPTTEAEAKARVCIHNDLQQVVDRDVCRGPGPWDLQTGHMHFHDHMALVVPLGSNRFAVIPYFTGGGCRGGSSTSAKKVGNVIEVSSSIAGVLDTSAGVCDDGMHDFGTGACITSSDFVTVFYDARTGKPLLELDDHDRTEKLALSGSKLARKGPNGCDESLDLRKPPKGLAPGP